MSELDDLYLRARRSWEQDPQALEHEQPLLARCFADKIPDFTNDLQARDRTIAALEERIRSLERELEDRMAHAGERERRLKQDLRASERGVVLLTEELEHTKATLAARPSEAELLSTLGWSKSAAD